MRLRNPGGIEAVLSTVKQVRDELGNASVNGHNAADRKNAFLSWCDNWASGQLGNHFPPGEGTAVRSLRPPGSPAGRSVAATAGLSAVLMPRPDEA